MSNYVEGKTIIVTGAAGGFGQLVCEKTAAMGAQVIAADVNEQALEDVVSRIRSSGGQATPVKADVTRRDDMHQLAGATLDAYGQIDVMLNNAGIMPLAFYSDHESAAEAWERCIDINLKGVLNGIAAVHDPMIKQGRGHVVNIASIYGNYPTAGGGVYGATKAAVVFLSESLRMESQGKIKVTTIRPTGVPATGLSGGIVNPEAVSGLLGINTASYMSKFEAAEAGQLPASHLDVNDIEYFALDPSSLADQIVHAINQPWGVAITDMTVRASGDGYVI
ncbi:MAG: SDR family oxidoreductase [Pseudomonadales bacterium]|nr:SDR family oxidoreductase [Pseudomonadales bacterium]MBO6563604.1 SDR family oxidoreductase [Pseudomonadales bacterium]MBO6596746.1 SDR family oxidoreductase [Pseudomonadales bacterium]MBO6823265.1 SDR family oxidoreductase [Pseudomonadales bacterium]